VGEEEVFQTRGPNFVTVMAAVRRTGIFQEQAVYGTVCVTIF